MDRSSGLAMKNVSSSVMDMDRVGSLGIPWWEQECLQIRKQGKQSWACLTFEVAAADVSPGELDDASEQLPDICQDDEAQRDADKWVDHGGHPASHGHWGNVAVTWKHRGGLWSIAMAI